LLLFVETYTASQCFNAPGIPRLEFTECDDDEMIFVLESFHGVRQRREAVVLQGRRDVPDESAHGVVPSNKQRSRAMPSVDQTTLKGSFHCFYSITLKSCREQSAYRLPLAGSLSATSTWCRYISSWYYHQCEDRICIIKSWHQEGHPTNGNWQNCHITRCRFDTCEPSNTASVSPIRRMLSFSNYILMLLNINDDDEKRTFLEHFDLQLTWSRKQDLMYANCNPWTM